MTKKKAYEGKLTKRMLSIELADPKFEEVKGGLLIKNVTILAEGTFTDSLSLGACHYSAKVLQEYAANWVADGYWLRHPGGSPRPIDDKVGKIVNPHFEKAAVMGDILLHLASSRSRDHAEMVKAGVANALSAELNTSDAWDDANKRYDAKYIEFSGVASVDRGACSECKIRANELADEATDMEKEELEKQFSELRTGISKEMDAKYAPLSQVIKPEDIKALSEKFEAQGKLLEAQAKALETLGLEKKALEERLKVVEGQPNIRSLSGDGNEKELTKAVGYAPSVAKGSIQCE